MSQLQDKQFTDNGALMPFLKRLFAYAIHHKKWFWGFVAAVMVVGITDASFPLIWMYFLDVVVVPAAKTYQENLQQGTQTVINYDSLWLYIGYFVLNAFFQVIGVYYFIKFAGLIQENVMYRLREQMFTKLQKLPFAFYDRSATGWLLSRISSDTERVTELISWGFLEVIWGGTMITFCLTFMFFYHWKLALIVLFAIPILVVVSFKVRILILNFSRAARKLNSEITANYTEHINGVQVNKITAQEERVSFEFDGLSDKMRHASFRASYYTAMYMPLVIFIGSVAAAIVLFIGGKMALDIPPSITVGILAAFFGYATQIFIPILDIARFYAMAQGSLSAGERIFSLIDEEIVLKDAENATDFDKIKGEIHFKNLDFSYVKDKKVLENMNLHIKAGQSVALVGATGEGKTTITNLVCRFYEPTAGELCIDGINYMEKTIESLRKQMGIVLQTPHLFSGTIGDNVKYGKKDATDEEVKAALRLVGAEEFGERLAEEVGEGGDKLSTGEKQLLSFARALLTNPRILIMDEATSSIDTLTEAKIQDGIEQMIKGRTAIIVAHRLSTIKNCDRILVIKQGKIIEDGSHQVLMEQKGHYQHLYTKQVRHELVG
ncbi:MAG: ABC transporter ATP-binding protein [Chitinophagales bacterium]